MRNIADIYVSIMCICNKFIDSSLSKNNIQHSMLNFYKENTVSFYFLQQGKYPTFNVSSS